MKVNWKTLKVKRSHRCCQYSGTVDCAPCDGPRWKWPCYQEGPKQDDPQQRWVIHQDSGTVLALMNSRKLD
jgi:hypothetical protein